MRAILSIVFLSAFLGIKAQNNIVVFSENGEKFFLIVNGVKQNIEAETNVKVTDLIQPQYKVKVVFEDKAKGVVDQNIFLMDGGEPVKNHEFVYGVKMTKKASYKIRPISMVNISESKPDPSQTVVHYSTSEPTSTNNNVISESNEVTTTTQVNNGGNVSVNTNVNTNGGMNTSTNMGGTNMNTNVQITETKTQTQTNNGGANGANVGVNIGGMGVNININDNMGGMGNSNTTVTSQTITTTTSSSSSGNVNMQQTSSTNSSASTSMSGPSKTKTTTSTKPKVDPLPGYTGAVGCSAPISSTEFANVKKTIETKNFEDSKIKIAKQVIDNNCLLSSQVKEIMMLFNFEETRLDLAKYAYGHTYDIGNYYKLNDAFKFEASIDELDEFIKSNKSTK